MAVYLEPADPRTSPTAAAAFLADLVARARRSIEAGNPDAEVVADLFPVLHRDYFRIAGVDAVTDCNDGARDWFAGNVKTVAVVDGRADEYDPHRERWNVGGPTYAARIEQTRFVVVTGTEAPQRHSVNVDMEGHPYGADVTVDLYPDAVETVGGVNIATYSASMDS